MDRQRPTIYLAGPISGCNKTQKSQWRKDIKKLLVNRGYEFIDPTETPWDAHREFIDVDRSNVVIANLWRESIGTVVGIVRARRLAKPVIVINTNHIESRMLEAMTGKEWWVRGLQEAANKLENEIAPLWYAKIPSGSHLAETLARFVHEGAPSIVSRSRLRVVRPYKSTRLKIWARTGKRSRPTRISALSLDRNFDARRVHAHGHRQPALRLRNGERPILVVAVRVVRIPLLGFEQDARNRCMVESSTASNVA
jgi:hypothetical protein